MNYHRLISLILFVPISSVVFGQGWEIGGGINYATYSMEDLKSFQSDIIQEYDESKLLEDFPAYWSYDAFITRKATDKRAYGIWGRYQSSGSRIYYADYSGKFQVDTFVNAYLVGFEYAFALNSSGLWGQVKVGVGWNTYDQKWVLDVINYKEEEKFSFNSLTVPIILELVYQLKIMQIIRPELVLGYDLSKISTELVNSENDKFKLDDGNTKLDWSGFRFGFRIGIATR